MRKAALVSGLISLCLFSGTVGGRSAGAAVIAYSIADINALIVDDAVPEFLAGSLISGTDLQSTSGVGSSNQAGTSYTWVNDMTRQQAAGAANNRWINISTSNSEIWDLGIEFSSVVVGNGYDHDRDSPNQALLYLEALEWTAWGSNDLNAPFGGQTSSGVWELGILDTVYRNGWNADPNVHYDDFTGKVTFTQPFRYIHVIAQDSISIGGLTSGDNEIDFVGGVSAIPEPSTALLLGLGLVGVGVRRRV